MLTVPSPAQTWSVHRLEIVAFACLGTPYAQRSPTNTRTRVIARCILAAPRFCRTEVAALATEHQSYSGYVSHRAMPGKTKRADAMRNVGPKLAGGVRPLATYRHKANSS